VKKSRYSDLLVCVVGYGSIGRRHAANIKNLGARVVVYRSGLANSNTPNFDTSLKFIYEKDDLLMLKPDAMVICNPTSLHFDFLSIAVDSGIHVFVEKPVAGNSSGFEALLESIERKKLVTCVGYMMRYDTRIKAMKQVLEQGQIGNVTSAIIEWGSYLPSWHPWENYKDGYAGRKSLGGGAVLTCSHEIDTARYLLGDFINVTVSGGSSSVLGLEVEDYVDIFSRHYSGATCLMHIDWFQKQGRRTVQIIGEEGRLEWDFFEKDLYLYSGDSGRVRMASSSNDINKLYIENMEDFLSSIVDSKETLCSLEDGLATLSVCELILDRLNENV
jgi:predicted dehydrogenase